jgi:hypothetical protein
MIANVWTGWCSIGTSKISAYLYPVRSLTFTLPRRPSIAFYEKVLGAKPMKEWTQERLELDGIARLRSLK